MKNLKLILQSLLITSFLTTVGCDKHARSFSILDDTAEYKQNGATFSRKIDILWVIDNSGSMESSQNNLAQNFLAFYNRFEKLNFDFHMAVTTTDAYLAKFNNNPNLSLLKDGNKTSGPLGHPIMDNTLTDLETVFLTNIKQGISGYGDERAFDSFEQALTNPGNSKFLRSDAFLAVIIVSDEDDFSTTTKRYLQQNYNAPEMIPLSHYTQFLDKITNSGSIKNYSVSAISVFDQPCLDQLNSQISGRVIGKRYGEIVDATAGVKGSLCSNFGETLQLISDSIIELSSVYNLTRKPIVETITVVVDGVSILEDELQGWTYNETENSIHFHGSAIPKAGATIAINFDPLTIKL